MLATIGIKIARATTFSMVSSKRLMTEEAIKAVTRLAPNQRARFREVFRMGANRSSSSFKPAMLRTEWSASSIMTSTTSSIVIRPSSMPALSVTGIEMRSYRSNNRATSCFGIVAATGSTLVSNQSMTGSSGSATKIEVRGSPP